MTSPFNRCVGDKIREPVMEHHHTIVVKMDAGLMLERFDEHRWDLEFGELDISVSSDQLEQIVRAYLEQQGMDQALELVEASWALREDGESETQGEGHDV